MGAVGAVIAGLAGASVIFLAGWLVRDVVVSAHGDWVQLFNSVAAWMGDSGKVALGALIAALAGLAVGWMGRVESRASRQADSAARFSDRIRELAVQALEAGDRDYEAVAKAVLAARVAHRTGTWDFPEHSGLQLALRELSLLVLRPQTLDVVFDFEQAFLRVNALGADYINHGEKQVSFDWWVESQHRYFAASDAFANAIRAELGRPPRDFKRSDEVPSGD